MNGMEISLIPLKESLAKGTSDFLLENENAPIIEDSGVESFAQVIFGYSQNPDEDSVFQGTKNKDLMREFQVLSPQLIEKNEEAKIQKDLQKLGGDLNGEVKEPLSKSALQSQGLPRILHDLLGNPQKDHFREEDDGPLLRIHNSLIKTSLDKNPEFSLNENGR